MTTSFWMRSALSSHVPRPQIQVPRRHEHASQREEGLTIIIAQVRRMVPVRESGRIDRDDIWTCCE